MKFQALNEFLDESIVLPIGGKNYTVKSPDAHTGLLVSRMLGLAMDASEGMEISEDQRVSLVLSDDDERELAIRMMGPTLDEMAADGINWATIQHVQQTVMVWCAYGMEAAAGYWSRFLPKAPGDHKEPKKATPKPRARTTR